MSSDKLKHRIARLKSMDLKSKVQNFDPKAMVMSFDYNKYKTELFFVIAILVMLVVVLCSSRVYAT